MLEEMQCVYEEGYPSAGFSVLWNKIECTAHTLNLAAQQLLKGFKHTVDTDTYSVVSDSSDALVTAVSRLSFMGRKIKASPKKRRLMEKVCNESGRNYLVPIIDVVTRWNSTFDMISRAYEYKDVINQVVFDTKEVPLIVLNLTEEDWECVHQLIEILEPMKKVTLMVSQGGEALGITRMLGMYHHCLKINMAKFNSSDDIYIGMEATRDKLLHYYDNLSPIVDVALLLDPSKKEKYLRHALGWKESWIKSVLDNFKDSYQFYKAIIVPTKSITPSKKRTFDVFEFDTSWDNSNSATNQEADEDKYIRYLSTPHIKSGSILDYWKANHYVFPVLARMAKVLILLKPMNI
jgi:hypothetical protein